MAEWSKALPWKGSERETVPQVRILSLPPFNLRRKVNMYYTYILFSLKDKKFYIGFTAQLKRRLSEHKRGKVKSTKNRLPIRLVCYESYLFKKEAGEAQFVLHKEFRSLKRRLTSHITNIEKTGKKRKLTVVEKRMVTQLKKELDLIEDKIEKEIKDIQKEVK